MTPTDGQIGPGSRYSASDCLPSTIASWRRSASAYPGVAVYTMIRSPATRESEEQVAFGVSQPERPGERLDDCSEGLVARPCSSRVR